MTTAATPLIGAPGLYKVTVEKDGFKQAVLDNVQVAGEQMNPANVILDVGAIAESVTVNGDQLPAIDTESGQIAGTVTSKQIQHRRRLAATFFSSSS